jgi:zinc transport system substrate-binding protein
MDYKKIIFILVSLSLGLFFLNLITTPTQQIQSVKKPIVLVTTFSIFDITKHIAQESIELIKILPAGVSPHSFEPTPKLMAKIEKSALVIFSGGGLEPWVDSFHFKNSALNISKYVHLRKITPHKKANKEHHHSNIDPHFWLDIDNMIITTNIITNKLIKIAPKNKVLYLKNQKDYIAMLQKLQKDFTTHLQECKLDTLVTNHNAFSYIATKYHFKTAALSGLSPQAMPSAKKISYLMKRIEKEHIQTIFFESFANEKVIRSIAKDTHIEVNVLHPLGNITARQEKKNSTYEDIMRENLIKITKALKCR